MLRMILLKDFSNSNSGLIYTIADKHVKTKMMKRYVYLFFETPDLKYSTYILNFVYKLI